MRVIVLGAAAGGGLPQWNCGCENCRLAREGRMPAASQSALAVSGDGRGWAILNASPDIRSQFAVTSALHPTGARESPVRAVVLTNGDIDHVAGLLGLREKQGFDLVATPEILRILAANPVFDALDPSLVRRRPVTIGERFDLVRGLTAELFAVPGKVPLYLEGEEVLTDLEGEQTVGVALESGRGRAFYVPGCASVTPAVARRLSRAALVFFDGTLWRDDEMIRAGVGQKTGRRMGHVPMSGAEGSIAAFAPLGVGRKVFVHMNNTNPVLRPGSEERAEAEAAGWEIAHDGMEVAL
jgi:pyrroloquinoline quinone biosynthesis protein B